MKRHLYIILIVLLLCGWSQKQAYALDFTLSDEGIMALDWIWRGDSCSRTSQLLSKVDVPGPGVEFEIYFQGNTRVDSSFSYLSYECCGDGTFVGLDVRGYDAFSLTLTLLAINGESKPGLAGLLGVGALIGPYNDSTYAYNPYGLDFDPDTARYEETAHARTLVRTDYISLLGFTAYMPRNESEWSPDGTTVRLRVEPSENAIVVPEPATVAFFIINAGLIFAARKRS